MTGRAILRRQCIRAKRTLMKRWPRQYDESCFEDAHAGAYDELKGTPMFWSEPSYYEGESDCKPAVDELRWMVFAVETDWAKMARQMEIRDRKGLEATH